MGMPLRGATHVGISEPLGEPMLAELVYAFVEA